MIRQSAVRNVMVFMTQSGDHVTGLTGATLTVELSKNGGAFASISPTVTERAYGWYNIVLTASNTDTLGDLALHITASGADPNDVLMEVVDLLDVSVEAVNGTTVTGSGTEADPWGP
jgi:hypothetical protein